MKNWDKYIDIINSNNNQSTCKIKAATKNEIEELKKAIMLYDLKLGERLKDYLEFLMFINGYNYDGIEIYSTKNYIIESEDGKSIQSMTGFIEFYEDYRFYGTYKKYEYSPFFFGKNGEVGFAITYKNNKYIFCKIYLNDPTNPEKTYNTFDELLADMFSEVYSYE